MPATKVKPYEAKTYNLQLDGISQKQLEVHYKLYQGYVANTNTLNEKVSELFEAGKAGTPEYAELRRRFGFEYDGMRLHEYYFENLKGPSELPRSGKFVDAVADSFGSFDAWLEDFKKTATMRGIGWVILYQDPNTGRLQNFWITDHENGHPAGFQPVLVMDMWEHAFMVDYMPAEKGQYVEAFLRNVNWQEAERRLK